MQQNGAQRSVGDLNHPPVGRVHFQDQEDCARNRQRSDEQLLTTVPLKGAKRPKLTKIAVSQRTNTMSAVVTGNAAAGVLSAPNTLKAREAGLNLLADIGKFNIFGLQSAYWATEQYLKDNPNVIYAFLKAVAEGTILSRKDPAGAQRAIAKHVKLDDPKMVNETYSVFEPYMVLSLALRREAIQAQLAYLDEKQFPQARDADVKEFFDNSFVENLERSGFFQKIGLSK